MSFSILLLPLLGGYYYLTRSKWTKHRYKRKERQRLIFDSALYALIPLGICFLGTVFFKINPPVVISLGIPFLYTSICAFLLSYVFTKVLNILTSKSQENVFLAKAIMDTGNTMYNDLLEAYVNGLTVMITLKIGKVYVGAVKELPDPNEQSFISILPYKSGYRTPNMDVEMVTDYISVYQELDVEDYKNFINTETSICENEIVTVTFYEEKVFSRFKKSQ